MGLAWRKRQQLLFDIYQWKLALAFKRNCALCLSLGFTLKLPWYNSYKEHGWQLCDDES